ncbi:unnamed protein product [Prorocentrum cordatum]|uniref:Ankyrin repeat domain-containing protein n=1 Tax=Prorocentrum cordatum TaxID=2364126 RepID=A0ABN9PSC2_9DINO|nr:unnamed protein product [Polarella glacialis]
MAKRKLDEVEGGPAVKGGGPGAPAKALKKGGADFFDAAEWGKAEKFQEFLDQGVDPNSVDEDDDPVLFTLCMKGHAGLVERLLASGAEPSRLNDVGFTGLMIATRQGHASVVKALLAGGADPSVKNPQGETALDIAHKEGKGECAALLAC